MSRLLGNRKMIKELICQPREILIHNRFWVEWFKSEIVDSYDAMGVCLMGGEL